MSYKFAAGNKSNIITEPLQSLMVEYLENWAGLEVMAITAMHSEMCKESFNWERLQTSPDG